MSHRQPKQLSTFSRIGVAPGGELTNLLHSFENPPRLTRVFPGEVEFHPHKRPLCLFLLPWLLILSPMFAPGQEEAVFSTDVNVVNVIATVRDKKGALINDLTKDDFVLKENGKQQTIRYFSRQTDLPLTIGLLVDTSMSQARVLEQQRTASYRFLDRVLREKDQAFVISFDLEVTLLQDLTNSKKLLEAALRELKTPAPPRRWNMAPNRQFPGGQFPGGRSRGRFPGGIPGGIPGGGIPGGGIPGGPGGRGRPGGPGDPRSHPAGVGTALYDAVYLAANEVLKDQAGRKALVVISDGVDMGSKLSEEEAIEAVHRADGIIYSVYFSDRQGFGGRFGGGMGGPMGRWENGEQVLRRMSEDTGGQLYKLSDKLTLDQIFDRIEEDLRSQYSIGYTPENNDSTEFRKIELQTKKGGLKVFTRSGYYPSRR
jgi:VWFA-related protein